MKLMECILFKNGKKKPNAEGNIPIYGGNGILGYTNEFNSEKNSIIIGRVGAYCGCVYKEDNKCWISDNAIVGYPKENYDYLFMYYYLKFKNLNSLHIGSGHPLMTQDILNNIEVDLPNYDIQKKIGILLSRLDNKIKLNNEINNNLYDLINTIYKDRFSDVTVFKKADEFANVTIGKTPPRSKHECFTNNKSDVKWISISDLGKCGIYIYDTNEKLTEEAVQKYNVKVVPANTILLSFKLTVGRTAITTCDMTTNEAIAHFNLNDKDYMYYLYSYLNNYDYSKLGSTSSIATAVNSKIIKAMSIGYPEKGRIIEYNNIVKPIFEKIKINEQQNIVLSDLRDTLLPKLMNGEIDLDNIEI